MLGLRRRFPDLLGSPGSTGSLDLLSDGTRVQDAMGLADGQPGIGPNGANADLWDDAGADSQTASSFAIPTGRTPLTPQGRQMAAQAGGMAGLDAARMAPVTPGPPAHGTAGWMPPGERGAPGNQFSGVSRSSQVPPPAGGGSPDLLPPQAAQPGQPVLSGVPPKKQGSWWNEAAFDPNAPTSRLDALAQMLGGAGRAIAQAPGGSNWLGAGLSGATGGLQQAEAYEGQRQRQVQEDEYRRGNMELQRRRLEQRTAPQTHVVGGALVDDTGREIYKGDAQTKAPPSLEAALMSSDPEVRTRAEQLWREKEGRRDAISPAQQAQIDMSRERLGLERQRMNISRQQAGRSGSEPMVQVFDPADGTTKYLPRSQAAGKMAPPKTGIEMTTDEKGRPVVRVGGSGRDAGPLKVSGENVGRASAVPGAMEDVGHLTKYFFPNGSEGEFDREAAAKVNAPLIGAVPGTAGVQADAWASNAIDTMLRLRSGAEAPAAEKADARKRYLPSPLDPPEAAATKLRMLQRDLGEAQRLFAGGPPSAPGGRAMPSAPADEHGTVKLGAPQAGAVEDGYRFKGGNPADPAAWEPVQ